MIVMSAIAYPPGDRELIIRENGSKHMSEIVSLSSGTDTRKILPTTRGPIRSDDKNACARRCRLKSITIFGFVAIRYRFYFGSIDTDGVVFFFEHLCDRGNPEINIIRTKFAYNFRIEKTKFNTRDQK